MNKKEPREQSISSGSYCRSDIMKKPNLTISIVVFLIIGLMLPAVLVWAMNRGMGVEGEYAERGVPVSCKVYEVTQFGNNQTVRVKYKSAEGEWISASCTANQRVSVDQTLEGYVLPESPHIVYCPPGMELRLLCYALIGAIAVGGWAVLVSGLRDKSRYDNLLKNGVPYKAQLTSWHKEPVGIVAQFRIFTRDGQERIIDITAQQGAPIVGESYDIILAEVKGGKVVAALVDENLR